LEALKKGENRRKLPNLNEKMGAVKLRNGSESRPLALNSYNSLFATCFIFHKGVE